MVSRQHGFEIRYSSEYFGDLELRRIEAVRTSGAGEVLASANGYDNGVGPELPWRINIVSGGNIGASVNNRIVAEQWLMLLGNLMTNDAAR